MITGHVPIVPISVLEDLKKLYECPLCGDVWKVQPVPYIELFEECAGYTGMMCIACNRSVKEKPSPEKKQKTRLKITVQHPELLEMLSNKLGISKAAVFNMALGLMAGKE